MRNRNDLIFNVQERIKNRVQYTYIHNATPLLLYRNIAVKYCINMTNSFILSLHSILDLRELKPIQKMTEFPRISNCRLLSIHWFIPYHR